MFGGVACALLYPGARGRFGEEGRGKREEGRGKREEGRGKREEGRGKREEGRGKREEDGRCLY
jgi:hypothetical protein